MENMGKGVRITPAQRLFLLTNRPAKVQILVRIRIMPFLLKEGVIPWTRLKCGSVRPN